MQFEVKTEKYSGPLEKLLELTQEKKIDISDLALAKVTEDFIQYVESLEGSIHPLVLADFISVASKLLLIKSKIILPSLVLTEEEEEDIKDLEFRLQIYRSFCARGASASGGAATSQNTAESTASQNILSLWERNNIEHGRKLLQGFSNQGVFYPPGSITSYDLQASIRLLFTNLADLIEPQRRIKIKVVTLQEKMAELKDRLEQAISHDFKTLSANRPKQEVIVLFLAVLHLFAHKALDLEQEGEFGNITIKRKEAELS